MKTRLRKRVGLALFGWIVAVAANQAQGQPVIYVDAGAAGANDGTGWADAFTDLQNGLAAAVAGDELWVATGTYTPTTPPYDVPPAVAVYGGFAGDETFLAQRDPSANPTILDGAGTSPGHLVTITNGSAATIVDGLQITGAIAGDDSIGGVGGAGAGMLITGGAPAITNCQIVGNQARIGSGVMVINASPVFTGCRFSNTSTNSGEGAGIYAMVDNGMPSQTLTLVDCEVSLNSAMQGHYQTGDGAGVFCGTAVDLEVTRCRFLSNFSFHNMTYGDAVRGGGIFSSGGVVNIRDSLFSGNYAALGAGIYATGSLTCINCVFTGNRAVWNGCTGPECADGSDQYSGHGGGVYCTGSTTVINCTFSGNWAAKTAAGAVINFGTVQNSILWWNETYPVLPGEDPLPIVREQIDGGADLLFSNIEGLLEVIPGEDPPDPANFPGSVDVDPQFAIAPQLGSLGHVIVAGDFHLQPGSPCIDASDNDAVPPGVTTDLDGNPRFIDDPETPDSGNGTAPIVDMGAHEFQTGGDPTIPTVSEWGLLGMTLLMLTAGAGMLRRRQRAGTRSTEGACG